MRILFDHGTPAPLAGFLQQHSVHTTVGNGWDRLANGELLTVAEQAGYDLLLTTDKNIRYQQNLKGRKISIVVLSLSAWPVLKFHIEKVVNAVELVEPGSYAEVEIPRGKMSSDRLR